MVLIVVKDVFLLDKWCTFAFETISVTINQRLITKELNS